jgi:hypothetical protein
VKKHIFLFTIFFIGAAMSTVASAQKTNRVEELMIWKISEELRLSIKEEKELSAMIRSLDERKAQSSEKIEGLIQQFSSEKEESLPKLMKEYKDALNAYNSISLEELTKIQKILPKNKAAKYFVIKSDLTKKIRSLLASSDRVREKNLDRSVQPKEKPMALPEPKILEE